MALAGPKGVVAHLSLDAAGNDPIAAGTHALFEDLVEDRLMQGFLLPRGE
jgi:hypothetical protein